MRRRVAILLCAAFAAWVPAAGAYWHAGGSGTGIARSATLPAGPQPAAVVDAARVTLTWSQVEFGGQPLGAIAGGGYEVRRYPTTGGAAVAACVISGGAAVLTCEDTDVPPGAWRYAITPVLHSWTGDEGAESVAVATILVAPVLEPAVAEDPGASATTGDVRLRWSAVGGAAGYDVYRRTSAGTYDRTAPLNGATPLTGTSYTDPGAGLPGDQEHAYVVRAVAATGAGPDSNEVLVTPVSRPAAPAAAVAATAAPGGRIEVSWQPVAGAVGYDVYRRTAAGAYDDGAPLNGSTPLVTTAFTDATAVDGGTYHYVVRAQKPSPSGALLASARSAESATVTADAVAPAPPSVVTLGAGAGPLLATATCGVVANARFVNAAGAPAVPVTIGFAGAEAGRTVVLTASTPGSAPVTATVAAPTTTLTTSLNAAALLDGTFSLAVRAGDQAGNASAPTAPAAPATKDTAAALSGLLYTDVNGRNADLIAGTSECGARITAVQTAGNAVGATYPATGSFVVGTGGSFSGFAVAATRNGPYGYDVTATDLAGNAATLSLTGG